MPKLNLKFQFLYVPVPSEVVDVLISDVTVNSFVVSWSGPVDTNGRILRYEVTVITKAVDGGEDVAVVSNTNKQLMKVTGLSEGTEYIVKVIVLTLGDC